MKKAVIFDLDGTLINSLPDIAAAMNRTLARFGLPEHPEADYKYKVGNGAVKLAERSVGEHTEYLEQVLAAYRADYAQNSRVNTTAYRGVIEMLTAIEQMGVRVCVLSNKDQSDVENVMRYYFPSVRFSVILGRAEGVALKPDPAGALRIAGELELKPEEIWFVGDTGTDMQCGAAAGMDTIGVLWGFRPREELIASGARELAADPQELTDLIRRS